MPAQVTRPTLDLDVLEGYDEQFLERLYEAFSKFVSGNHELNMNRELFRREARLGRTYLEFIAGMVDIHFGKDFYRAQVETKGGMFSIEEAFNTNLIMGVLGSCKQPLERDHMRLYIEMIDAVLWIMEKVGFEQCMTQTLITCCCMVKAWGYQYKAEVANDLKKAEQIATNQLTNTPFEVFFLQQQGYQILLDEIYITASPENGLNLFRIFMTLLAKDYRVGGSESRAITKLRQAVMQMNKKLCNYSAPP